ncbi:bifunctional riboflavin kinase/FAD synthetase [Candidatus Cryosericum septentrionale]|jgi:riboflavin kinase/FMN adenylyltransferase|uniref:Riboflavin biosynthesis protein n=1 Tax=Candidatus Cryosericum septentrionale TaxID=2290913 RepID=A0A398DQD4_9BACT|nr:bifunctional riboflavin kinase/FAD synthetase [Candidatus Cryosericum septentrionale]RIE17435.1 bifunctional riboflavin kinase/FAD synthetase [Candidatus Cryosericum septentrionale]
MAAESVQRVSSIYLSSSEFPGIASVVAVGAFDGFHVGHQRIVRELVDCGHKASLATVIYTFRRNPKLTTRGIQGLLTTNSERVEFAEKTGVDSIVLEDFSARFQGLPAEVFVSEILISRLNACVVVVGQDFHFGKGRAGDAEMMSRILDNAGRRLIIVAPVMVDGEPCSSSIIRTSIAEGDMERAARLLGRSYSIEGVIVTGNQIGGRLGFPTANVEVPDPVKLLPGNGVYAVRAVVDGAIVNGVCNIGVRPTIVAASRRVVEVHLLDFDRQVYGHLVSVQFAARLRGEVHFASPAALVKQISRDVLRARVILGSVGGRQGMTK